MGLSKQGLAATSIEQTKIRPIPIAVSLMIGAFIGLFSETALNMAFTNIMTDFQIDAHAVQWLTTGYLLVLGILVPVSALLLQWFTTRQLFNASLIFSIIGTIVAALSPNFELLLVARVIQAIGTGLLLPLMTNVILVIFPPLALTFVFGLVYMQNVSTITKPKIDILSIILSSIGFGGIVFGFSSAGEGAGSWGEPGVFIPIAIGAIALVLFAVRQLRMKQPMLNLRVFKFPMFSIGVLMVFLCMMLILSTSILLPMYLKGGLLLTAFAAGLVLLPGGIINGLMSPVTGRLFDKFGPKFLVIPGFIITTILSYLFTNVTTETPQTTIIIMHTCIFIGVAMIMMPAQTNGLNQLPRAYYPDGSAVMNTLQQIAGTIGTAVAVSIMVAGQASYVPSAGTTNPMAEALTSGVQNAFMLAFVASIIGLIASFFIKRVNVK